jgi:hypothetical protein
MRYQQPPLWEEAQASEAPARARRGRTRAKTPSDARTKAPTKARAGARAKAPTKARTTTATAPAGAHQGGDEWRLDESTRRAGRQGLAMARAALARAAARADHAA